MTTRLTWTLWNIFHRIAAPNLLNNMIFVGANFDGFITTGR